MKLFHNQILNLPHKFDHNQWLQKCASVTFCLTGGEKIAKPLRILELSNELDGLFGYQHKVEPDLDDLYKFVGKIYWFTTSQRHRGEQQIISDWIKDKSITGYQIQAKGPVQDPSLNPGYLKYEITITANPSQEYPELPDLNVANSNARALLQVLGLPSNDLVGELPLADLQAKLSTITDQIMQTHTRETQEWTGDQGAHAINFGLPMEQIESYIERLMALVTFGLAHQFTHVSWA